MNAEIEELISEFGNPGDFTRIAPTPEKVAEIQTDLGVTLPKQFLDYLAEYSHGGICGVEILGIGLTGRAIFEEATIDYRKDGLPANYVVVENCDEWLYCIDCDTGEIVSWSMYDNDGSIPAYPDFDSFLLDSFKEAADNM